MSAAELPTDDPPPRDDARPRPRASVPSEGASGVYSQSWFPLCRSSELPPGQVIGRPFLGGKVALFRGSDGQVRVMSSYCMHMGADLSRGTVVEGRLRCPFHHFEYGDGGHCVKTGSGAAPPKGARLFEYPARERWGLVWAFNGEQPLWELPLLDRPEGQLLLIERDVDISTCEPYMVTANAFDWQHFGTLHDFHSSAPMDPAAIRWDRYSCGFKFQGRHWRGEETEYKIEIYGTNIYLQQGSIDGTWYAMAVPMGVPRPGLSKTYMQILIETGDESPAAITRARYAGEALADMEIRFIVQDQDILNNIHFGPGCLVEDDRQFMQFIRYLRNYPRGNPGRHYLE